MANMGYCRFRNTAQDLRGCLNALGPYENEYEISTEEVRAGIRLFESFLDYCRDVCIIDDYDRDAISRHFEETNATIRENKEGDADDAV